MKTLNKLLQSIVLIIQNAPGCRLILAALLALGLCVGKAQASPPFNWIINATNFTGYQIPYGFSGIGILANQAMITNEGKGTSGELFDPTNVELMTLWQQLDLHHMRLNWGLASTDVVLKLNDQEVDNLFHFCQTGGDTKVIFSLQLDNEKGSGQNLSSNEFWADYVWKNYSNSVDSFALGNEPEDNTNFASPGPGLNVFLSDWNSYYTSIYGGVRGSPWSGPDSCFWDAPFVRSEGSDIGQVTMHLYLGAVGDTGPTAQEAINHILSNGIHTDPGSSNYPFYLTNLMCAFNNDIPYRFTEFNDYEHGVEGASDGLAGALWALDGLHWLAAHSTNSLCSGVDFWDNETFPNAIFWQEGSKSAGFHDYFVYPKGEAIKAWDIGGGGQGFVMNCTTPQNPEGVNVRTYGVGNGQDLYVTLINETNTSGPTVLATNYPQGFLSASVAVMYMLSASANLGASNDTTLGGAYITNNAQWQGMWTPLAPCTNNGYWVVSLPPAEAAVVHLRAGCAYDGPICDTVGGALYMYTIGPNGDVYESHQNGSASAPANWYLFGNPMGVLPGSVTAASGPTVVKDHYGDPAIFVVGSDGNDYRFSFDGSPTPYTWTELPNSQGITNLQAQLNSDGSVILFGLTNGNIYYTSETAPSIPSGVWNNLGNPNNNTPIQGYAVAQNLDGHLEVFGVDSSGNLWHIYQKQANNWNTWGSWSELDAGGATVNPPLQVVRNSYGYLYIFGMDIGGGSIDYIDQMPGGTGGWSTWDKTDLTAPSGTTLQPGFVVAQNNDGRFEVFDVGGDHNLYHIYNPNTTSFSWSAWGNLGGASSPTPYPQLVVGNTSDSGRVQVFATGSNGDVWSIWQNPPPGGGWSSWTDFGSAGNGQIFY